MATFMDFVFIEVLQFIFLVLETEIVLGVFTRLL